METTEIIALITGIAALVIAAIAWHRSGQPLTLQGVQEIASSATVLADELQHVANTAVASAQQLKESGKINSNDEAFKHAVNHVEAWYNSVANDIELDPKVVANAVESAYFFLKKLESPAVTSEAALIEGWQRLPPAGNPV